MLNNSYEIKNFNNVDGDNILVLTGVHGNEQGPIEVVTELIRRIRYEIGEDEFAEKVGFGSLKFINGVNIEGLYIDQ